MRNLLNKGDVVKTSLSDSTLVLKVEKDDALLFTGSQFVVAHGVQKENDKVFWNQGYYYDELPDNIFERNEKSYNDVKERISELDENQGKGFSYQRFCEYVRNKMSTIYQNEEGQYTILEDTQALQEFGFMTEKTTLRHIYDNNLFEEMEEIIDKNPPYIYDNKLFEQIEKNITKNSSSIQENNEHEEENENENEIEIEDDWELEA